MIIKDNNRRVLEPAATNGKSPASRNHSHPKALRSIENFSSPILREPAWQRLSG